MGIRDTAKAEQRIVGRSRLNSATDDMVTRERRLLSLRMGADKSGWLKKIPLHSDQMQGGRT